jgi:hypothetical protein
LGAEPDVGGERFRGLQLAADRVRRAALALLGRSLRIGLGRGIPRPSDVLFSFAFPAIRRFGALARKSWGCFALQEAHRGHFGLGRWKGAVLLASFGDAENTRAAVPFARGVFGLFSGTNAYRYLSLGMDAHFPVQDLIAALLVGLTFTAGFIFTLRRSWRPCERVLCCALVIGLLLFWGVMGAAGLAPSSERYALWMVLPSVLLFTRTGAVLCRLWPRAALPLRWGFIALCCLFLVGFQRQYFRVFLRSGGHADPTFQTGRVEPKWAAWQIILEKQRRDRSFVVASSDWWVFWPMRYRAYGTPNLTMLHGDEMNSEAGAAKISRALKSGDLWFAEFSNSLTLSNLKAGLQQGGVEYQEYSASAADGRPVVTVLQLHQK